MKIFIMIITTVSFITNVHLFSCESNSRDDNVMHLNYVVFDVSNTSFMYLDFR